MKISNKRSVKGLLLSLSLSLGFAVTAAAGEADVIDVTIESLGGDKFRVSATLDHGDTGWDHYANRWDVLDESGNILGSRVLGHPHVNEMPFTRSLSLSIPANVKNITIQANDSVDELGGKTFSIDVPHPG